MEVGVGSTAIVWFAVVGFLSCAWRVLNWVWFRPKKMERWLRQHGFNGNPYRILHGDSKEIVKITIEASRRPINLSDDILPRAVPFHHHLINKYGKNSFFWSGPIPRVNIMEPELINEIFLNHNVFKKQTPSPLLKMLLSGLASYEDEKWAKHRKIMTPAFYADKLKHMLPAIQLSCSEMITKWEVLLSENSSFELDVFPHLSNLTSDVISRTAFGSSYEEGKGIFELQRELANLVGVGIFTIYIPGWRFVPTKRNKRMKEINSKVKALVMDIIKKRENAMKLGDMVDDNLLNMLLKSNKKEIKESGNNKDAGMSIEDIVEECKLFYFAGQETTANLLVWTMILLSMHPNWQARARKEVFQVFGKNKPDYDGLNHLKIVTMILNEVLRLYPPVVALTRVIEKEVKIRGMDFPVGTRLTLPIIFMHYDCEIWGEDAQEFNPLRFSEGIAKATRNQVAFLPFSWGPRTCIANNFAMMEAKMAVAMILQHFSFELSPTYTHAPSFVVTLQPQNGAHLILHKLQY